MTIDTGTLPLAPSAGRRGTSGGHALRQSERRTAWMYLLPALVVMTAILFYPIAQALVTSVRAGSLINPIKEGAFVGFKNYARVLNDPDFWRSLQVTVIFTVLCVAGSLVMGMVVALLLERPSRGRGLARALIVVPWAVPPVVAAMVWILIFNPQFGPLNYVLTRIGVLGGPTDWLTSPTLSLVAVIAVTIWQNFPIAAVMFLSGLQTIDPALHEAAAIDGASYRQRFRNVTLPGLAPITTVLVLLLTVWIFRGFVIVYLMTGGGPDKATSILVISVYQQAFQFFRFGYATALGTITLIISLAFSLIYLAAARRHGRI